MIKNSECITEFKVIPQNTQQLNPIINSHGASWTMLQASQNKKCFELTFKGSWDDQTDTKPSLYRIYYD